MKRQSKKNFKQIMIPITIKHELDSLKEFVRKEKGVTHRISYADIIIFLIKKFKNSLRVEYQLNQGLLVGTKVNNEKLSVSIPIKPKPYSASVKLDGKIRVSNLLES